jgi:nitroreductase
LNHSIFSDNQTKGGREMNVIEALQARRSTRAFLQKPVDRELLLKVLADANSAPSYANSQPWEVFVAAGETLNALRKGFLAEFRGGTKIHPDIPMVKTWPDPYKMLLESTGAAHLEHLGIARDDKVKRSENIENNLSCFGAPAVIYLCLHKELTGWSFYDLGLFSQSLMLAAQHYGLNTMQAAMMVVYPELIRNELEIPENLNIVLGIAVGYAMPDDLRNQFHSSRKTLDKFARIKGI